MASRKEFADYLAGQFGTEASVRPMMGEYLLYYRGKLIGGIYDDRLLVKDVPEAAALLEPVRRELPYEGAKPMLVVELDPEDKDALTVLAEALYAALPETRRKK